MLGKYMQYTCAYFNKSNMTLDEAQLAKMKLIAKKLDLKPKMTILDIGRGFGSLGYYLAKEHNVNVLGVTLSKEQHKYAQNNYYHPNLKIELKDYRNIKTKTGFDRVFSVGMFEHVGKENYKEYYDTCYNLLKKNGIMLLHTICNNKRNTDHNTFINEYIFPEGQPPHTSDFTASYTDKWMLEDIHNFGLSYEKTLMYWYNNLENWKDLEHLDSKFKRIWTYYLLGSSASFKSKSCYLLQLVYTKLNNERVDNCHHIRN